MTKASYVELCQGPRTGTGPGGALGSAGGRPGGEVDAIRRALDARLPVMPHPCLRDGERVRILRGPMADVEGS